MLGQMINALGEQRYLDICGTCIPFVKFKIANRFRFSLHDLY
jgi:hypothetical protein